MTTEHADGLRTLFISGLGGDTRRYRCFHQQEQLALQGVENGFCESDDPQLLVDVLDYDIFVLHRVPYSQLIGLVIDLAHLRGKPVVFETDDLVFDPELYEHIGFVDTLAVEAAREFRDNLRRLAKTFQRCDCVLTTTEFLAEEARRRGKPAYVNRNTPSSEMIRISEQAFATRCQQMEQQEEEERTRPVVIAYFSGTGSHNRDFGIVAEPLIWALGTYPQVWLHISGHLELGPEFSPFHTRIRRAPYVAWRELPHLIAETDVNLAPLELDNPFCRAKSENKFVEAALVGVPTIASQVEAYEFAITDGEDGLLVTSSEEWKNALQTLLDDPERRCEIGRSARHTAYARCMPDQRAIKFLETLQTIAHQYGGSSATREQILRELASQMKQYADQMRTDTLNQKAQMTSLRQVVAQYESQLAALSNSLRDQLAARDRIIEQQQQIIERREQTIEAIMQGRVMRLMTGTQRWLRKITRRGDGMG
ncbi:MAG: glycosyltransferase [Chloroflexota bacterium]|nr:glycosyltransferase [Chloroflexota bacterium]